MFPQYGPQMGPAATNGWSTSSSVAQNNSLLGAQPTLPQNQTPNMNTTAPLSSNTNMHPAVQNMINALKGGM